jgi:hypothetical protein
VDAIMNLGVAQNFVNFVSSWGPVSFSGRTQSVRYFMLSPGSVLGSTVNLIGSLKHEGTRKGITFIIGVRTGRLAFVCSNQLSCTGFYVLVFSPTRFGNILPSSGSFVTLHCCLQDFTIQMWWEGKKLDCDNYNITKMFCVVGA